MCFRSNDEELNRTMAGPISLRPFVFLTCVYGVTMKLCLRTSNSMHNVQKFVIGEDRESLQITHMSASKRIFVECVNNIRHEKDFVASLLLTKNVTSPNQVDLIQKHYIPITKRPFNKETLCSAQLKACVVILRSFCPRYITNEIMVDIISRYLFMYTNYLTKYIQY